MDVTAEFRDGAAVPIGRPVMNTRAYVLDAQLQVVPIGVLGELMISGVQLARGYLDRPDLTAEKFIANPYSDGHPHHDRLYRTGEQAAACVCLQLLRNHLSSYVMTLGVLECRRPGAVVARRQLGLPRPHGLSGMFEHELLRFRWHCGWQ